MGLAVLFVFNMTTVSYRLLKVDLIISSLWLGTDLLEEDKYAQEQSQGEHLLHHLELGQLPQLIEEDTL